MARIDPLELIAAHPWRRACFTSYALSLSFFEVAILDALVRGGGREAKILADVEGVRAALSEHGARRVGKDYDLEPVLVPNGVFHPKLSVLLGEDDCHVLVGSGNLTFGGWGGNLEVVEHLHSGFAADAMLDAAGFFDLLALSETIRHGAADLCADLADALRNSVKDRPLTGELRLFHSLDGPIAEKLVAAASELGGAERLVVAAPYWDGGALDQLCNALGLDHAFLHAHPGGTVEGKLGANWPVRANTPVRAISLNIMDGDDPPRRLHAKVFELICKRGRIILSGSANATRAALYGSNVEACVARILREKSSAWAFKPSECPALFIPSDAEADDNYQDCGVLRATLDGDELIGQVLTPPMAGEASLLQLTTEGPQFLGRARLSEDGSFRFRAPGLEVNSWKGGRLVIRAESAAGATAEGFVSIAAFTAIARRMGAVGPRLLALLAGAEVPSDIAAIMSWFNDDPRRLAHAAAGPHSGGGTADPAATSNSSPFVAVAELNGAFSATSRNREKGSADAHWSRFVQYILGAFRERRGPLTQAATRDSDNDEQREEEPDTGEDNPAIQRAFAVFEKLLAQLLSDANGGQHAIKAFDLAQYLCDRLRPEPALARDWLERIVSVLLHHAPPTERRADVASAIVTLMGVKPERGSERVARGRLLRLGASIEGAPPPAELTAGYQSVLVQVAPWEELWGRIRSTRTFAEHARAYLAAMKDGAIHFDCPDWAEVAGAEWPILQTALGSPNAGKRVLVLDRWRDACPKCNIVLPSLQVNRLREHSVATAKNCCGRIIIWPGV